MYRFDCMCCDCLIVVVVFFFVVLATHHIVIVDFRNGTQIHVDIDSGRTIRYDRFLGGVCLRCSVVGCFVRECVCA